MRHAVTAKIALGRRCKVVGSERCNPYRDFRGKMEKLIYWMTPLLDGCVFQTKGAGMFYPTSLRRKSTVIPNGVSFGVRPQQEPYTAREKSIIVIGRITRQKRHDLMIQAFSQFHKDYPEYRLTILGKGEDQEKLLTQIRENGLEPFVTLLGFQKNVGDFLTRSRMFVLTSDFEGMPNVLLEAMACGCACISTDCDFGPSELIEDGENGLLVRVGDADAICQAMCRIAEDDALGTRFSENAQKINETHSMDVIAEQYHNYLSAVVKGDQNVHCEGLV